MGRCPGEALASERKPSRTPRWPLPRPPPQPTMQILMPGPVLDFWKDGRRGSPRASLDRHKHTGQLRRKPRPHTCALLPGSHEVLAGSPPVADKPERELCGGQTGRAEQR